MSTIRLLLWIYYLNWICLQKTAADVKFTNLKCQEFDKPFAIFKICNLKVLRRHTVGLNVHVQLLQLPVNNVTMNLALLKKVNSYQPFLYNQTADFCALMQNKKRFPFLKIFWDLLAKDSNINHTCPYNHDIIVSNLTLVDEMFQLLPLPAGDYMFNLRVGAYNDWKADVKAYFRIALL